MIMDKTLVRLGGTRVGLSPMSCRRGHFRTLPPRRRRRAAPHNTGAARRRISRSMVVSRFQGSPAASLDTPMAPQGLVCHICGRQYFKDSMPIHLEQCLELYNQRQALLPPSERRPPPTAPTASTEGMTPDQYNDMAYAALEANMATCEHCGRTFAPDRLAIHQRSCTAEKPARRPPSRGARTAATKPAAPKPTPKKTPPKTEPDLYYAIPPPRPPAVDPARIKALEDRASKLERIIRAATEELGGLQKDIAGLRDN